MPSIYKEREDNPRHCPQCGDALSIYFYYSKLVRCASCGSSVFLNDEAAKSIGKSAVLSPEPSLLQLHTSFLLLGKHYMPIGKIRYSYGRGFWEEWFLKDKEDKVYWLSIDEGDFVLEVEKEVPLTFRNPNIVKVGKKYGDYIATEKDQGICVGFDGELPDEISVGQTHGYIHLSAGGNKLVTVEYVGKKMKTFEGYWINPLEIKTEL